MIPLTTLSIIDPRHAMRQRKMWRNPRVHATTQRIVNETFAEEKPALKPLPLALSSGSQARTACLPRGHGEHRRESL